MQTLFIRMAGRGMGEWALYGEAGLLEKGTAPVPLSDLPVAEPEREVVFFAPGTDVLMTAAEVPAKQRRHLRMILPYLVEEQLAEDVSLLHVAAGAERADGKLAVAVARKALVQQWLDILRALELMPVAIVPETALVPDEPGKRVVLCDGTMAWLRLEGGYAGAMEKSMLPDLLKTGSAETDCLLFGEGMKDDTAAMLAGMASVTVKNSGELMLFFCEQYRKQGGVNLLQGHYVQPRNVPGVWNKVEAIAAAWAIGMVSLVAVESAYFLHRATLAQDEQTALYQSLFPADSKIVDPVSQMKGHLGAEGGSSAFLQLAADMAGHWPEGEVQMQSLNYKDDERVLTLSVSGKSIEAVNGAAEALLQGGMDAKVISIISDKAGVTGQIVVKGRAG